MIMCITHGVNLLNILGTISSLRIFKNCRRLFIRFLTGSWCLACFVLVTAYSSVLVSILTAPLDTYKILLNSVNDLPLKPEIRVVINKGWIMDVILKV